MMPLPLFDNEKNALNPVSGEATFSHLSGEDIFGRFFHLDLLHTALSKFNNFFYMVDLLTGSDDRGVLGVGSNSVMQLLSCLYMENNAF